LAESPLNDERNFKAQANCGVFRPAKKNATYREFPFANQWWEQFVTWKRREIWSGETDWQSWQECAPELVPFKIA
jgi:hypothetical protein